MVATHLVQYSETFFEFALRDKLCPVPDWQEAEVGISSQFSND